MEIIFQDPWLAWIVGILLSLLAIKLLVVVLILVKVLAIFKKVDKMVEEFGAWQSYVMEEVADIVENISDDIANIKNVLSFAGLSTAITKLFNKFKRRGIK